MRKSNDSGDWEHNNYPNFIDDLDKTSATDFFNRTNGLGSPDYYAEKRRKEQEEKENAALKNRRTSRNRSSFAQPKTAPKVADVKKEPKVLSFTHDDDDFSRRFSAANKAPIALPEHPKERRSSFETAKPTSTVSPTKTRRASSGAKPSTIRSIINSKVEKRTSEVVKQPVVRKVEVPVKPAKVVEIVKKPVAVSKPIKVVEVVKKPVVTSKPTKVVEVVKKSVVSKPVQVSTKVKRVSEVSKPVVSRPLSGIPNQLKTKPAAQKPVVLPDRPERDQVPAGPMTRSREKARRRGSFMMPTESSLRRSTIFSKSTSTNDKSR